jgi:hypothetical protein
MRGLSAFSDELPLSAVQATCTISPKATATSAAYFARGHDMFTSDISLRRTSSGSIDHDFYSLKAKQERSAYLGTILSRGQPVRFVRLRSPLVTFALGIVVGAGALGFAPRQQEALITESISPHDLTLSAGQLATAEKADTY